ncbi:MAG: molybdopterin-dependent oxidoreductase [Acidobacteria bacterium]|nr:molybdopterin-dependent oxidoreductase [Acidobacteriota bacterium]
MPKFHLDGREIEVAAGTTFLQAALDRGLDLPHYCYHPALSIPGNCRICLVEVEKAPKLLTSCSTEAAEGMVVRTDTERVREARRGVMEFLLINHPLDCPICDQAGECRLQEYAILHGSGVSRFEEDKVPKRKRIEVGPHVLLDEERCILCTRCIRFCREITGTDELDLFERGDRTVIGTFPGRPLDNLYSGNVVDICPVGALTSREFRFRSRVWFLRPTASICAGCARGCNIWVDADREEIARLRPRRNDAVNGHWICDVGRNGFEYVNRPDRLLCPLMRGEGALAAAAWKEAVDRAAEGLRDVKDRRGGDAIGWVVSGRLTNEEAFLVRRLAGEALGGGRFALAEHEEGEDDRLLLRRDRTPNRKGVTDLLFSGDGGPAGIEALAAGIRSGAVHALVVLKEDPLGADPGGGLDAGLLDRLDLLVVADIFLTPTAERSGVVFPAAAFVEEEGTYTNFQGRVQRARPARRSPGAGMPGWMLLTLLGRALDADFPYRRAEEVTRAIGAAVPAWADPIARLEAEDPVALRVVRGGRAA